MYLVLESKKTRKPAIMNLELLKHSVFLLTILVFPSQHILSQVCDAGFIYDVAECGEVHFIPNTSDSTLSFVWDFGDGEFSTEVQPNHLFTNFDAAVDTFMVSLTVSGDSCSTDSSFLEFELARPFPLAAFSLSGDLGCSPFLVEIDNSSDVQDQDSTTFSLSVLLLDTLCSGAVMDWSLDTSSIPSTVELPCPGTYVFELTAENECGEDILTNEVIVVDTPQVEIGMFSDLEGDGYIFPELTVYNSCYDSISVNYEWQFPGGSPGNHSGENPPAIFYVNQTDSVQLYEIALLITDACGTHTVTQAFDILPSPIYDIELSADTICSLVEILNPLVDTTFDYSWSTNAENAEISNPNFSNPVFDFSNVNNEGSYEITLVASNAIYDTIIQSFDVFFLLPPEIVIDEVDNSCAPMSFIPQANYGTNNYEAFNWKLSSLVTGEEIYNVDSLPSEETFLPDPGLYELLMEASNYCGIVSDTVRFEIYPQNSIEAQLEIEKVCQGEAVNIFNNYSGADSLSIDWLIPSLLDISSESDFEPVLFTGSAPASTYEIVATLSNSICPAAYDTLVLEILLKPSIDTLTYASNGIVCSGNNLLFYSQLTNTVDSIAAEMYVTPTGETFDIIDLNEFNYIAQDSGVYNFDLFVESANTCRDTASTVINVNLTPKANFLVEEEVCFGDTTTFLNSSSLTFSEAVFFWSFENEGGGFENSTVVQHFFQENGQTYDVQLVADNQNGCQDTIVKSVTNKLLPEAAMTVASACLGDASTVINNSISTSSNTSYLLDYGNSNDTLLASFSTSLVNYDEAGLYTLQLTVDNSNGCLDTVSVTTEVYVLPVVDFLPPEQLTACLGDEQITLNGLPEGGVFSGLSIINTSDQQDGKGFFDPIVVGQNIPLTYTYTDINGCVASDSILFTEVYPLPNVELTGLDFAYCLMDDLDTLIGSPLGGSFFGPQAVLMQGSQSGEAFLSPQVAINNDTITYEYIDQNGCANSAIQTFTINELPVTDIIIEGEMTASDTILIGADEVLILTNTTISDDFVFVWSNGNNESEIEVQNPGFYTLTILDQQTGCVSSDTVLVDLLSRVDEVMKATLFTLRPNPASNILGIHFEVNTQDHPIEIYLFDQQGRQIRRWEQVDFNQIQLDISGIPSGGYWLKIGDYLPVFISKI